MDRNELQKYYNQKQVDYNEYVQNKLNYFKKAQGHDLFNVIINACEKSKLVLENSNKNAFIKFFEVINELEVKSNQNYPKSILDRLFGSAKKTLDDSLKFNQSIFEQSIGYYKRFINE